MMEENTFDQKQTGKVFSRIGLSLCVIMIVSTILQGICFSVPGILNTSWGLWLATFAPLYLIAVPVGLLVIRRLPAQAPQENRLGGKNFFVFVLIAFFLMYGGNLIGTFLSLLLSGGTAENALDSYAMDNHPIKVLFMVILAPLIEEYIFRKQIIDRTAKYGEKMAVFFSGFTFGLFHMNLYQFFYAFALGMMFAYVYIRTGRLRYSVILHAIVNFFGSVLAPLVLSLVDMEALSGIDPYATTEELMALYGDALPGLMMYMLYVVLLLGLSIAGLVLFILQCRKLVWREAEAQLPKGTMVKTVYRNVGMILFILMCLVMIVVSLFI